nr:11029_t:CDS:2 [Entrophospora candida]
MTSNFDSRGLYFPNSKNAGRPPNIVWTHFNKGTERYPGKYDSTCIYCNDNGTKGSPQLMQEHLANRCPNVPVDVKQVFLEIILRKHQDDNFFDATDSLTTSNSSNSSNILGTRNFINEEVANVNVKVELELKRQNNITLAMDGWTDPAGRSIYNYVALTSNGKDHSHQGNHYLKEAIQRFEISGGGLKTYIKTRWSSAWDCLNSVKRLENGLKWIVSENPTVITNGDVLSLLQQRNFFSDVEILCEVLKPIKEAVVSMQTNHANLADCFIHMCHIAKIHSYYVSNAKKEFNYYGKDITERETTLNCILSTMNLDEIGTEEENHFLNSHYEQDESDDITYLDNNDENEESDIDILKIEDIVNLNDPIFDTSENAIINEGTQERRVETMNYLAEDIVQEFLAEFEDT